MPLNSSLTRSIADTYSNLYCMPARSQVLDERRQQEREDVQFAEEARARDFEALDNEEAEGGDGKGKQREMSVEERNKRGIICPGQTEEEFLCTQSDVFKLKYDAVDGLGALRRARVGLSKPTDADYKVKLWQYRREAIERAIEVFMTSDKLPDCFVLGRKWYLETAPAEGLPQMFDDRTIYELDSFGSMIANEWDRLNLIFGFGQHREVATLVNYSMQTATAWLTGLSFNFAATGVHSSGKSYVLKAIGATQVPGVFCDTSLMTGKSLNVGGPQDCKAHFFDELTSAQLGGDVDRHNTETENILKSAMTSPIVRTQTMIHDSEAKERISRIFVSSHHGVWLGCYDGKIPEKESALFNRWFAAPIEHVDSADRESIVNRMNQIKDPDMPAINRGLLHACRLVNFFVMIANYLIYVGALEEPCMDAFRYYTSRYMDRMNHNGYKLADAKKYCQLDVVARTLTVRYAVHMALFSDLTFKHRFNSATGKYKNFFDEPLYYIQILQSFLTCTRAITVFTFSLCRSLFGSPVTTRIVETLYRLRISPNIECFDESCFESLERGKHAQEFEKAARVVEEGRRRRAADDDDDIDDDALLELRDEGTDVESLLTDDEYGRMLKLMTEEDDASGAEEQSRRIAVTAAMPLETHEGLAESDGGGGDSESSLSKTVASLRLPDAEIAEPIPRPSKQKLSEPAAPAVSTTRVTSSKTSSGDSVWKSLYGELSPSRSEEATPEPVKAEAKARAEAAEAAAEADANKKPKRSVSLEAVSMEPLREGVRFERFFSDNNRETTNPNYVEVTSADSLSVEDAVRFIRINCGSSKPAESNLRAAFEEMKNIEVLVPQLCIDEKSGKVMRAKTKRGVDRLLRLPLVRIQANTAKYDQARLGLTGGKRVFVLTNLLLQKTSLVSAIKDAIRNLGFEFSIPARLLTSLPKWISRYGRKTATASRVSTHRVAQMIYIRNRPGKSFIVRNVDPITDSLREQVALTFRSDSALRNFQPSVPSQMPAVIIYAEPEVTAAMQYAHRLGVPTSFATCNVPAVLELMIMTLRCNGESGVGSNKTYDYTKTKTRDAIKQYRSNVVCKDGLNASNASTARTMVARNTDFVGVQNQIDERLVHVLAAVRPQLADAILNDAAGNPLPYTNAKDVAREARAAKKMSSSSSSSTTVAETKPMFVLGDHHTMKRFVVMQKERRKRFRGASAVPTMDDLMRASNSGVQRSENEPAHDADVSAAQLDALPSLADLNARNPPRAAPPSVHGSIIERVNKAQKSAKEELDALYDEEDRITEMALDEADDALAIATGEVAGAPPPPPPPQTETPVSDLDREDSIDPDHDMHQLLRAAIGSAAPRMRSAFSAGIKTSYGK